MTSPSRPQRNAKSGISKMHQRRPELTPPRQPPAQPRPTWTWDPMDDKKTSSRDRLNPSCFPRASMLAPGAWDQPGSICTLHGGDMFDPKDRLHTRIRHAPRHSTHLHVRLQAQAQPPSPSSPSINTEQTPSPGAQAPALAPHLHLGSRCVDLSKFLELQPPAIWRAPAAAKPAGDPRPTCWIWPGPR